MISSQLTVICLLSVLASTSAWIPMNLPGRPSTAFQASLSRDDFLKTVAVAFGGSTLLNVPAFAAEPVKLDNGVTYIVKKTGDGERPVAGDLVALRFAAYAGDKKIDDLFDNPEPYYTRVGSGGLLKGVEATVPLMRVGDRWELTIPANLAFGPKGRPASAGKARIPGDVPIIFDVEMVGLPGKERELIDIIGD